jgi:hypothetical protein
MLFAVTALEKLTTLPAETWIKIGIAVAVVILAVVVLRKLAGTNRIVVGVVAVVAGSIFFFSWIYNRNEPAFLTPVVDKIAPFFPSKGSYNSKQQTAPAPKR